MTRYITILSMHFIIFFHLLLGALSNSQDRVSDTEKDSLIQIPKGVLPHIIANECLYLERNGMWDFLFKEGAFFSPAAKNDVVVRYKPFALLSQRGFIGAICYEKGVFFIDPFLYESSSRAKEVIDLYTQLKTLPTVLLPYPNVVQTQSSVSQKNINKELILFEEMKVERQKEKDERLWRIQIIQRMAEVVFLALMISIFSFILYVLFLSRHIQGYLSIWRKQRDRTLLKNSIRSLNADEVPVQWHKVISVFKKVLSSYVDPSQTLDEIQRISGEKLKAVFPTYDILLKLLMKEGYRNGPVSEYKRACSLLAKLADEIQER